LHLLLIASFVWKQIHNIRHKFSRWQQNEINSVAAQVSLIRAITKSQSKNTIPHSRLASLIHFLREVRRKSAWTLMNTYYIFNFDKFLAVIIVRPNSPNFYVRI